uniref:HTH TFE/IIEalpha-type domain-containing protein n=1 Tax=Panagrellus redivivus TaxID=6233 RepID=A0A7E4VYC3_PANRE
MSATATVTETAVAGPSDGGSKKPLTKPGEKLQVVPEFLKAFTLTIAKTFYGVEHFVIADYIQRNVCVKEEKLRQLLKFDPRSLKPILTVLKVDKLVKERIVTEEIDGKQKKVPYYYINYKGVINVTKYKLDQIRQKLESREMAHTHQANYICTGCKQKFGPLEVGMLWNAQANMLKCWTCFARVEDEETAGPSEDTRSSLAKFNEQTGPLVTVMQSMNGVIFADNILEPPVPTTAEAEEKAKAEAENNPKRVLGLGERFFNADAPKYTADTMKLNLGGEIDYVETEKEAVPWLKGSVRISLADIERKEAQKKSREIKKANSRLNRYNAADADNREIDELLKAEKEKIETRGKRPRPTLDDFIKLVKENATKRLGEEYSSPPAKRPKFTLGDEEDSQDAPANNTNGNGQSTHPSRKLSPKEQLQQDLQVNVGGKTFLVNQITESTLAQMTPNELEQYHMAYERLIDLVYRTGW